MISVCMATYNGEKYIEEQLRSILCQINPEDEIIISDDGSTDKTLDIIQSFHDERIKLFFANIHHFKWNFYNALIHAKGDYIFLSDQDDVWLPNKVNTCLNLLQRYDLIVHNSKITDEYLNVVEPSFFTLFHSKKGLLKNLIINTYCGCCMVFKKHILKYALPFPKSNEIIHDFWIGMVAEIVGKVHFLPEPLILYRRHQNTKTHVYKSFHANHERPFYKKIYSRFVFLTNILRFMYQYKHQKL